MNDLLWQGFNVVDILISEILPQADPTCLKRLEVMNPKDDWTSHLLSLEKYRDEVIDNGWLNPISISHINQKDLSDCPSRLAARDSIKYIIGVGYNRHYWSHQWGEVTIKAIISNTWLEAQEVRSLMEAGKKGRQLGIRRISSNLYIPDDKMIRYDLWSTRIPQRLLPMFTIDPSRIVEKIRGDRIDLSGIMPLLRPMPGARNHTSKFFQISGEPPIDNEPFEFSLMPEGWIEMSDDFHKYLKLFREWT